ncbi:hypothetical protein BX600DRAFT_391212 [Xylariales sp. PMI_506]|nr:hypothetical protein BX600DRAFT_391212 [Xylariales sp. PMI_506]
MINHGPEGFKGECSTREALDTAGGKILDEKTIRNIARQWRWPAAKFGMRQDDLFRELHKRHNTFPFAIQEASSFHRDVCDIAKTANCVDELHRSLDELKALRLRELDQGFDRAAAHLSTKSGQYTHQRHWENVLKLFRDRSYSALVRYLDAYRNEEPSAAANPAMSEVEDMS